MSHGNFQTVHMDDASQCYAYRRNLQGHPSVEVWINNGEATQEIRLPEPTGNLAVKLLGDGELQTGPQGQVLTLPGHTALVLSR